MIRLFEYDAQIALDEGEIKEDTLRVSFPNTAVLYLRDTGKTPDKMKIKIEVPGGMAEYFVPVLKIRKYDIEEIFEKRLYLLLPFYIFTYEETFEKYNNDKNLLSEFRKTFEDIEERLSALVESSVISSFDKISIEKLTWDVVKELAKKYKNVKKEVEEVMSRGPKIITEARLIWDEGARAGFKDGRKAGVNQIIENALKGGSTPEEISNVMHISIEDVLKVQKGTDVIAETTCPQ